MLELFKELLGLSIDDTSKDTILNFYINKSKNSIKTYLNIDMTAEQETIYSNQIVELALFYYKNKDHTGYKQFSQGGRSATIVDGIPESIKSSLPYPFVKVLGETSDVL